MPPEPRSQSAATLADRYAEGVVERLAGLVGLAGGEHHPTIGSTNDRAGELVAGGLSRLPYLVLASEQTAGRGRGANVWWSSRGAMTFSLVIDPQSPLISPARLGLVSLAAALGAAEAVRRLGGHDPRLKWPNDIYLEERKLAGVLVESPPTRPQRLIIGLGVNVNNAFSQAPADVQSRAISLRDATGRDYDLERALLLVLSGIMARLQTLAKESSAIIEEFRGACLLTGRQVVLETAAGAVSGLCHGVDSEGALRLIGEQGETRHFAGVVRQFS